MDIALVSYIYFELGNMIILAYELFACVLGFFILFTCNPKKYEIECEEENNKITTTQWNYL